MPFTRAPIQRVTSPMSGRSILMTSAPWSASIADTCGPVTMIARSSTRTPCIGPVM
jgi:hypothetical protein